MAASKLVIVESPAKARTIARFLGKDYKVEASQGHVRDFPKSQLGVDVDNDFALKYITIHGRGKILTKIRKEAKSAQEIYLATDPDREGEAISWHLAYALGMDVNQPNRIEFHEITQKAITDAIKSPRTIEMGLVDAQQARRALDRLVGYKLSPLLWAKIKKGLSAGRVQSVALRMLVEREQDIEAFIPEEYWDVTAHALLPNARGRKTTFKARLVTLDGKKAALSNEAEVTAARERVEKAHFAVYSVKNGEKRKQVCPALYHLQSAAGGGPQAELYYPENHAGGAAALRGHRAGKRGHAGSCHLYPYRLRYRQPGGADRRARLHRRPVWQGISACRAHHL